MIKYSGAAGTGIGSSHVPLYTCIQELKRMEQEASNSSAGTNRVPLNLATEAVDFLLTRYHHTFK